MLSCYAQTLVRTAAKEHGVMISIEEGSIGGFAAHIMQFLALEGRCGKFERVCCYFMLGSCGRLCIVF